MIVILLYCNSIIVLKIIKHKIYNMGDHSLPKIAFNSSQNARLYHGQVKPLGDSRKCCIAKY